MWVVEIDYFHAGFFGSALCIFVFDGYAVADELVDLLIGVNERDGIPVVGEFFDGVPDDLLGDGGVEFLGIVLEDVSEYDLVFVGSSGLVVGILWFLSHAVDMAVSHFLYHGFEEK